ncbi:SprT-like family-domain-containing protein [Russula compacta]|nr:SprT-like family-domain-containing protein [Russula compacta]
MSDVIEISSSDEDDSSKPMQRRRTSSLSAISSAAPRSCSARSCSGDAHGVESEVDRPHHSPRKPGLDRARARRIVYSSSSSSSGSDPEELPFTAGARHSNADDVIEITDSSDDDDDPSGRKPLSTRLEVITPLPQQRDQFDDDGLLVLNDPKSARRPQRRPPQTPRTASPDPLPSQAADKDTHALVKAFSTLSSLTTLTDSDSEKAHVAGDCPAPTTPELPATRTVPHIPANDLEEATIALKTPPPPKAKAKPKLKSTTTTPATKTPRMTKKALAQAEQADRAAYAQSLFDELNRTVFAGGLPAETILAWSNRLLTTAGRARWHRSTEGVHTTSIELATKILDCKERIRNTLSHEMCHLACWIINQDPKEGHGKAWKSWAAKVMRKRPDIEISTRHNYEISYPYEWECESCAKTYGRFSKSIRPDEVVCGACKTGALHPLFTVRSKTSSSSSSKIRTANGRMAATLPRDSPRRTVVSVGTDMRMPGSFDHDDDDEAELDELVLRIRELGTKDNENDD